jgi:hypothetical protein
MQLDSVSLVARRLWRLKRRPDVNKLLAAVAGFLALIGAGVASAQGMLLDAAADKVIKKYQTATCEELKAAKPPPSDKEKEAIEFLRNDMQARIFFINKIAAPVLNKMFDCGMIP